MGNRWHIRYILVTGGLGLMLALACSNKQELESFEVDMGYDYFPLGIGRSWTYTVDSVVFFPDLGGIRQDSSRTLVREVLVDTTRGLTGELLYRGERYERKSDTLPWAFRKVFTLSRTERQAIRQEDNVRVVVLPFPNTLNATWSPASYFDEETPFPIAGESIAIYDGWQLGVVERGATWVWQPDSTLNAVLLVENVALIDNVFWRTVKEYYAPGIGLVERQWEILKLDCDECCDTNGNGVADTTEELNLCDSLPLSDRVSHGFILHQRLTDYN